LVISITRLDPIDLRTVVKIPAKLMNNDEELETSFGRVIYNYIFWKAGECYVSFY